MFLMSMLFQTLKIPTTKVKYSNTDTVKKSLKQLKEAISPAFEDEKCNQSF